MEKIAIIGLGYVGLPLAVGLAKTARVVGYDIDPQRVGELQAGRDRTGEVDPHHLKNNHLMVTTDAGALLHQDVYIITVPTPVDSHKKPDLRALIAASETVGKVLEAGAIVVYESTVYPGVTEDICAPILERASGLVAGRDFFLGYSPERINPGDREHTLERITKVVAGQTPAVTQKLADLYGTLNDGQIFKAASIKTAEAAKVLENAQRDINIAFMNEVTLIFHKLGLSIYDVLAAANTKWNFLPFTPGLVGGHCIGVDPYYLAHCAQQLGHNSEVILAGRRINDSMGSVLALAVHHQLQKTLPYSHQGRVLVLGLTFKENVPDLRNSKVIDVIQTLQNCGYQVDVHDPHGDPQEAHTVYQVRLLAEEDLWVARPLEGRYDCLIGAVAHQQYREFDGSHLETLLRPGGLVADIKNIWGHLTLSPTLHRWVL